MAKKSEAAQMDNGIADEPVAAAEPGTSPSDIKPERVVQAEEVIHSHDGLSITQRTVTVPPPPVGRVVYHPEKGWTAATVCLGKRKCFHDTEKACVIDVIDAGMVNKSALSGDLSLLENNHRIKVVG